MFCISLLSFLFAVNSVFTAQSPSPIPPTSFCLCALRELLEDYAMFAVNEDPPRYRSIFPNDVGFYIRTSSHWKEVNNATWSDLSLMIKEPRGMYARISLDGVQPINNGVLLNSARSAYLGEIIAAYRSLMQYIDSFHERVIQSRVQSCSPRNDQNSWRDFF